MLQRIILSLIFINLAATKLTYSQISKIQRNKIDSLVAKWDNPNSPGGAIGIMCKGNLLYAKGFGLANLD